MIPLDAPAPLGPPWDALHIVADLTIGLCYVMISGTLLYLVVRARRLLPFHHTFIAFGAFIVACGFTHFGHVALALAPGLLWPLAVATGVTVVASVATAVSLPFIVPRALALLRAASLSEERLIAARIARAIADDRAATLRKIAHDLKNPLAAVKGFAELLGKRLDAEPRDEGKVARTRLNLGQAIGRSEDYLGRLAELARGERD